MARMGHASRQTFWKDARDGTSMRRPPRRQTATAMYRADATSSERFSSMCSRDMSR